MNKISFVLFAFLICVAFCPLLAHAETQSDICGDSLTWTLDDEGLLTISGSGPMHTYSNGSYNHSALGNGSDKRYH